MRGKLFVCPVFLVAVLCATIKYEEPGTTSEGVETSSTGERKPRCHHKGRAFEPGEILLSVKDCEVWICRNDTAAYGHVQIYECLTVDFRVFPNFHDACIAQNCEVQEVDTDLPYVIPWDPLPPNNDDTARQKLFTNDFY